MATSTKVAECGCLVETYAKVQFRGVMCRPSQFGWFGAFSAKPYRRMVL